jgi:hypothetical protein
MRQNGDTRPPGSFTAAAVRRGGELPDGRLFSAL